MGVLSGKRARGRAVARVVGFLAVLAGLGCNVGHDTFMLLPMPVNLQPDNLMTVFGNIKPTLDNECGVAHDDDAPAGSGPSRLLVDTGTPLSTFVPLVQSPALPFRHGQVALYASTTRNGKEEAGPMRVLVCDTNFVRAELDHNQFLVSRNARSTEPLGGVIGGDLLGRFAMTVRFAGSGADTKANLTFTRTDAGPSCQLDDAVLPFRPLGGQLAVEVGDAVITYPATRVTIAACVEPLADPLRPDAAQSCLRDSRELEEVWRRLDQEAADMKSPPDQATKNRLTRWRDALTPIIPTTCSALPDLADLGDVVEAQKLRRPAFEASGVDMQLLVSTAVPDLVLSQTACSRLSHPERCSCTTGQVKLRLPGLNPSDAEAEEACPIKLGSADQTALVLVARQRQLSACGELARSRRQRTALPQLAPPDGFDPTKPQCRNEACLVNLQRDSGQTQRRCGYSGLDPQYACDDHSSPVAAYVELGGPQALAGPMAPPDYVEALVVSDTARMLQAINADIRSDGARIDGVIGLSLLTRLATTVDYPQARVAMSCRCDDDPGHTCRAYRGTTYNPADSCSQDTVLQIPAGSGLVRCK